jgi:phosphoribosylanthranilate isomerase
MALRTFVKISSINNLSDARYCAGMYVNQLGFQVDISAENYISPEKFKEITDWVSGVELVAEFINSSAEMILSQINNYHQVDYLQVESATTLNQLIPSKYGLIFKVKIESNNDILNLIQNIGYYVENKILLLLESSSDELNLEALEYLKILSSKCQVLLGYGINAKNVNDLLEKLPLKGIALKGGNEIKPGLKDFDELSEILEVLETEDY